MFDYFFNDFLWFSMVFDDFLWFSMIFYDFLWLSMISWHCLWFSMILVKLSKTRKSHLTGPDGFPGFHGPWENCDELAPLTLFFGFVKLQEFNCFVICNSKTIRAFVFPRANCFHGESFHGFPRAPGKLENPYKTTVRTTFCLSTGPGNTWTN